MAREYVIKYKKETSLDLPIGELVIVNGGFDEINRGEINKIIELGKVISIKQRIFTLVTNNYYCVYSLNGVLPPPFVQEYNNKGGLENSIVLGTTPKPPY